MIRPTWAMAVGDVSRRVSPKVSQYGIRHGRLYKVRTVGGVSFITKLV